ncbi:hypothetical protein HDU83_006158, partial [Entophlyctis luteolus]
MSFTSLQASYSDSACTQPESLAYFTGESSCTPVTACTADPKGYYYKITCNPSGSFATAANTLFGASIYANRAFYSSSDCSGSATGYEADLLNACISGASGSFKFTASSYNGYTSSDCSGSPTSSTTNSANCVAANSGSTLLVNYNVISSTTSSSGPSAAGIGGGVAAAVVVLVAIGVFVWWRRRAAARAAAVPPTITTKSIPPPLDSV